LLAAHEPDVIAGTAGEHLDHPYDNIYCAAFAGEQGPWGVR
jgi:hypothetical protein